MLASHGIFLYLIVHQHLMITHLKRQINCDQVWAKLKKSYFQFMSDFKFNLPQATENVIGDK